MTEPAAETAAPPDVRALVDDLVALSSEPRLRLLHFLTKPHYGEEIAEHLGVSRQAAAKHLERLEERGFIKPLHGRRATGPVTEYQVVPQRIFALSLDLNELARLEPVGGPRVSRPDPTVRIDDEGRPMPAPGAGGAPLAQLVVLDSPAGGRAVPLAPTQERWSIGREEERDLRLNHDPFVSARHAEVRRLGEGFEVVDLFSANGTFLNFGRLPRGGRAPLRPGDIVTIGRTLIVLQAA